MPGKRSEKLERFKLRLDFWNQGSGHFGEQIFSKIRKSQQKVQTNLSQKKKKFPKLEQKPVVSQTETISKTEKSSQKEKPTSEGGEQKLLTSGKNLKNMEKLLIKRFQNYLLLQLRKLLQILSII